MNNKLAVHDRICAEIHEMYIKKNADYGDSVGELYSKLGDVSFLTRISDKYHRLMNLLCKPENEINYESVDDTIQDMANYCIIWLMERELKNGNDKLQITVDPLMIDPSILAAANTMTIKAGEIGAPETYVNSINLDQYAVPKEFFDED